MTPKLGEAKIKNFTIVPKQQVGQMTVNMTELDLKSSMAIRTLCAWSGVMSKP
ncbi:MAG: hypothetical protein HC817_11965 [Saprospiraceae bacterium]|nr:hypothetical protein [Saprospiraceae bacterium]